MSGIGVPCPLCQATFVADDAYVAHLADEHGLVDDEGTETTLEQAAMAAGDDGLVSDAQGSAASALAVEEEAPEIHPSRIYDPNSDDARWRPVIMGVVGLLLVGLVGAGVVQASGFP